MISVALLLLLAAGSCVKCDTLTQPASMTVQPGQHLTITCQVSYSLSSYYTHWIRQPAGKGLEWISRDTTVKDSLNNRFSVNLDSSSKTVTLNGQNMQPEDTAVYYCAREAHFIYGFYFDHFGSGTKVYVTDEQIVKPVVSVYPAASRVQGKSVLLCLASDMFPPLFRFSWKRHNEDGSIEELRPADGDLLQITESGRSAAILLVHQQENSRYKYSCYVNHYGEIVEAQTQHVSVSVSVSFQSEFRVKLLCLLYTVLTVKSLVYCCGLLMMVRNKEPSTNFTHAD
ncbi:immunoglobulin gamma-1 heavy chain-like isoform X2 [Melanotaenia boesemani]|uniref:immunoglobulin gamma-1 heavy chain-like isoform X2 n=1 Tax=Melanotaenia boesemani TaxID=1250792 RepID=UPI001C04AD9C|nr:immunoglobulin gamma-1 heavy chain-like isoform X2 [Melanotaenia boesemani]